MHRRRFGSVDRHGFWCLGRGWGATGGRSWLALDSSWTKQDLKCQCNVQIVATAPFTYIWMVDLKAGISCTNWLGLTWRSRYVAMASMGHKLMAWDHFFWRRPLAPEELSWFKQLFGTMNLINSREPSSPSSSLIWGATECKSDFALLGWHQLTSTWEPSLSLQNRPFRGS